MRVQRISKQFLVMGGLSIMMTLTVMFAIAEKAHADDLMDEIKSLVILVNAQSYQYPVKPDHQKSKYYPIIRKAANRYRLDPKIIQAIIHVESGYDPRAVSKSGAIGLMQLMPSTAREIGVSPFDPYQNVMGGAYYYRKMLSLHNGNHRKALWSYNCGPGCVERGKIPRETKAYANSTLRIYRNLKIKEEMRR